MKQANLDALTKIPNRRYFYEQLPKEIKRANRYRRPISLVMLDIDYFKTINDKYGHLTGDSIFDTDCTIYPALCKKYRYNCTIWRRGICNNTSGNRNKYSQKFAERLRKSIEKKTFLDDNTSPLYP